MFQSIKLDKDPEYDYLMNSVIIQTINMVKPRTSQTQNSFQGSNSNLKNFKKFKKVVKNYKILEWLNHFHL